MGRLVYPRCCEPIIPFCAAVSPTAGRILGEQNGGYVRASHGQWSCEVIALSGTGQLGMTATGQIQLT